MSIASIADWLPTIVATLLTIFVVWYVVAVSVRLRRAERRAHDAELRLADALRIQAAGQKAASELETLRVHHQQLERRLARCRAILRRVATDLEAE